MENDIYNRIERLSELLKADARAAVKNHGLQPVQLEVLHYLSLCNRFSDTPKAVSEYLGQTKGTVSQTIQVLERKGLLSKHADINDKRSMHLQLTADGAAVLQAAVPTRLFRALKKNLSAAQEKSLGEALSQLLQALIRANGLQSFGVCASCRHHRVQADGGLFCALVQQPLTAHEAEKICREHDGKSAPGD